MTVPPSQKELLELEQSKVEGANFVEAATNFLRYDVGSLERKTSPEGSEQRLRKNLAPREEFVLKLLLRRLSKSDDVFDGNFWALLAHLVGSISIRRLAHLLGERDFLRGLDEALQRILASNSDEARDAQSSTSSDDDSGRPTKKQKLRKLDACKSTVSFRVLSLVCITVATLGHLVTTNAEIDKISHDAVRNVLSAGSEDAANITGKLLQVVQKSLAHQVDRTEEERLARSVPAILSIWTYRRSDNVTSSGKSSDQHFTAQCLRPALRLLAELKDHPNMINTSTCMAAVKALERLVALHSVLPLRSLFMAEKAQQWRAKTNSITWHDFEDLQSVAGIMLLGPNLSDVDVMSKSSFTSILQYYGVAVRAVPQPTIRRKQQEQPWLDCLFCVCAYMANTTLPKMDLDESGHLVGHTSAALLTSRSPNANFSKLLTLAAEKAVRLSHPVLLYFMAATLESPPNNEQWRVLAKIVEQDVNVLVPNSGFLETTNLLEKIFERLSSTINEDTVDYALVRDGIIRPLLWGFAQARDLKGFVSLWLRGLQDAIQQRASGDLQYGQSHLNMVWEDELLFKDFEATTKALTTSTLGQSMSTEMLVLLQQAAKRVGPTSDIVSHVAITTSMLSARPADLDATALKDIITATKFALSRRSDYQLQRWRLWSLLRQCLTLMEESANIDEQLEELTDKQHFVSLSTVSDTAKSDYGYTRDARLREALECFRLAVARASPSPAVDTRLFETELEHLIALLLDSKGSKHKQSNKSYGQLDLVSSCIVVIAQQPQVLQHSVSTTARLIAVMVECLPLSSAARDDSGIASLIKALLLSEEISNNAELFNNCCSALLNLVDGHGGLYPSARDILVAVPLQALKKSLAQKLADVLVLRLRSDAAVASSFDQILPDLGLLEMLIATSSVSVGKPKKWAEFIDLAEHILSRTSPSASKQYQTALGCISKAFDVLWGRCQIDVMPTDMSTSLLAFQSRLHDIKRSVGSSSDISAQSESGEQLQSTSNVRDPAMSLDVSEATTKDLEEIAMRINVQVSSLGSEKSSELAKLADHDDLESRSFILSSAIICQASASDAAQDQSLFQPMGKLATLNFAQKASTAADLCLALETCKIILEKHPSVINQHIIDTLLSSIAALTSPSTLQITSNVPSAIFDRLCSILGLLLSRYRKRLGGRYHLILPALQGLLECLFFAGTSFAATSQTKSQVVFVRSLPSWLRKSKDPLDSTSAAHFTRILTTICDPSVSSIRRKKSNELTDETKKAKSLAGQYMQYLIMDFCRCSLHGRIPSSSKEKLTPGLYAVLDVMDRETMRGINGAMDSNGRAVWKGLYQDWERFGRWDRK